MLYLILFPTITPHIQVSQGLPKFFHHKYIKQTVQFTPGLHLVKAAMKVAF